MSVRTLVSVLIVLPLVGCGPYDGGGSLTAQHDSGLVQQVDLEGNANQPADVAAAEEAERLARAEAERKRVAEQRAEQERIAAEKAAAEAKAAEEAAAAAESEEPAAEEPAEGDAVAEVDPAAADVKPGEPADADGAEPSDDATDEPMLPPAVAMNPGIAAEGSLAQLLAEEARLQEEARLREEAAAAAEEAEASAVDAAPEEAPIEAGEALQPTEPIAALDPSSDAVAAVPLPGADPLAEPAAEPEVEQVPPADAGATGVLPPTWTPGSVPPCDPNDLAATPLRDLVLKQTFGDGSDAKGLLRSSKGDEFVVQKGSVVGPDGARVVRIAPGEVLLAVIQFDMAGNPVLVQESLRMDQPR